MSKRAVLYARVSGDDSKHDGRNLKGQLDMCRDYARSKGWRIVAELAEDDRGASGASFELEQLNHMLELARAGKFDVVVVREIDRFSRRLAKQLIVEEELKHAGVGIEYVIGEYADTPEGNLMKNLKASVAEYERLKTLERTMRAKRQIARAGGVIAHGDRPPFGYRLSEDGRKLVIYEPEAQLVRLIFTWYVEGDESGRRLSQQGIATKLTQLGIPTWTDVHGGGQKKRSPGEWAAGTLAWLLGNETYKGVWHFGRRHERGWNPRSNWIPVEVPAIVSPDLWERAQTQRRRNLVTSPRNTKNHYLMSGRLKCGRCGSAMTSRTTRSGARPYQYYCCMAKQGKLVGKTCDMPLFRSDRVDKAISDWVSAVLANPQALRDGLAAFQAEQETLNLPLRSRLDTLGRLVEQHRAQRERLLDVYLTGDIPRDMLIDRKTRLEKTIQDLEMEQESLIARLNANTITQEQLDNLGSFALTVADALIDANSEFETMRRLVTELDVHATLVLDGDTKLVSVQCFLDKALLLITPTTWTGD